MSGILSSTARVVVSPALKYLKQLAKHFSHKVDVEIEEDEATVRLSYGYFDLRIDGEDVLVMQTFADTDEHRKRLEHVAASHLLRFAFREPPEISWTDDT
ncbi:DUF2218 domain-containing protein [Shimia sp.]|uniref:DUF2218 domain-containing protein n=1 Tax=Shimia sp. TaxID=1954381 RepID=UPI003297736D